MGHANPTVKSATTRLQVYYLLFSLNKMTGCLQEMLFRPLLKISAKAHYKTISPSLAAINRSQQKYICSK